jgi:hypothetical protein
MSDREDDRAALVEAARCSKSLFPVRRMGSLSE